MVFVTPGADAASFVNVPSKALGSRFGIAPSFPAAFRRPFAARSAHIKRQCHQCPCCSSQHSAEIVLMTLPRRRECTVDALTDLGNSGQRSGNAFPEVEHGIDADPQVAGKLVCHPPSELFQSACDPFLVLAKPLGEGPLTEVQDRHQIAEQLVFSRSSCACTSSRCRVRRAFCTVSRGESAVAPCHAHRFCRKAPPHPATHSAQTGSPALRCRRSRPAREAAAGSGPCPCRPVRL